MSPCHPVKYQLTRDVWVYLWILSSIPLICTSVFIPILLNDCWSFVVSFEIAKWESSNFAILFQGCFGYSGYFNEFFAPVTELFFFLRPHLWHMEVPRLGVELELQLPGYNTATATPDLSCVCDLHHSSQQRWILNPLSESRDWTHILMDTSRIYYHDENS